MTITISTTSPRFEQPQVSYGCGHAGAITVPLGTSQEDARELAGLILCWRCQDSWRHAYRIDHDYDPERGDPWA